MSRCHGCKERDALLRAVLAAIRSKRERERVYALVIGQAAACGDKRGEHRTKGTP